MRRKASFAVCVPAAISVATRLEERIDALTQLRDRLDECIGCGCLSMKSCWLRNPWDKLAKEGSGPRLLGR